MSLLSTLKGAVQNSKEYPVGSKLDPETAYEILRNKRRRRILRYLASNEDRGPVPAGEIADHISREYGEDRTSVYIAAIQAHLPKMYEADVCEYDFDRKLVKLTATGQAIVLVHEVVSELTDQN